jgi:hypothetical protein
VTEKYTGDTKKLQGAAKSHDEVAKKVESKKKKNMFLEILVIPRVRERTALRLAGRGVCTFVRIS